VIAASSVAARGRPQRQLQRGWPTGTADRRLTPAPTICWFGPWRASRGTSRSSWSAHPCSTPRTPGGRV